MDVFAFQKLIDPLPEAQLRQLNSVIVAKINALIRGKQQSAAAQFKVGDLAKFTAKSGQEVTIRIEKFNTKSVSGKCIATGSGWRVAPTLLRLVGGPPAAAPAPAFKVSNVPAAPGVPPHTVVTPPPVPGLAFAADAGAF